MAVGPPLEGGSMIRRERDASFSHRGSRTTSKRVLVSPESYDADADIYTPAVYDEVEETVPLEGWLLYGRNDSIGVSEAEGHSISERSQAEPVEIAEWKGRIWWLYQGEVYSTTEDLEPDEVLALIAEKVNKKRIAIARAKAVGAMADSLDRKGERQPIPRDTKVAVWQRDQGRCVDCGSKVELEFDHIVPLALGGSNTERNIQLLCANCNRAKGASL